MINCDELILVSELLFRWGHSDSVLDLLNDLHEQSTDQITWVYDPKFILFHAECAFQRSQKMRARTLLLLLKERANQIPSMDRKKFLLLAEKIGEYDLAHEVISSIRNDKSIDKDFAIYIMRKVIASGDVQFAANMRAHLLHQLPENQSHNFDLELAILSHGSVRAAARHFRPAPKGSIRRSSDEARSLAHFLLHAGRPQVSLRYMRFCARRWPTAGWLPTLLATAHMTAGEPAAALRVLNEAPTDPQRDFDRTRLSVLFRMGNYSGACYLLDKRRTAGRPLEEDEQIIIAHLMHGELSRAKAAMASSVYGILQTRRAESHFKSSFLGKLFTEAEIQSIAMSATGVESAETVATFTSAAVISIANYGGLHDVPSHPSQIPKQVIQYWDAESIPEFLQPILKSWNSVDGWSHKLFSRRDAKLWIEKNMSPEHVKVFSMLKSAAEQSDFFRLCILMVEGGIYADLDDLRIGSLNELCALGRDLLLFQEPVGTAANNLICTTPAHMVIQRAIDMCVQAVLSYDNDIAWSKTGPGLLTRALAWCLKTDEEQVLKTTSLLPQYRMFPYVQPARRMPYKTSASHWNTRQVDLNPRVMSLLHEIVTDSGTAS